MVNNKPKRFFGASFTLKVCSGTHWRRETRPRKKEKKGLHVWYEEEEKKKKAPKAKSWRIRIGDEVKYVGSTLGGMSRCPHARLFT
jgi:hypothetical protein